MKKIKLLLLAHREKFNTTVEVVKSFADYAITKSKFSLLGGALKGLEELMGIGANDPMAFFSPANGWASISTHPPVHNIFISTLSRLNGTKLSFSYDNVKLYQTPYGEFVVIFDKYSAHDAMMLAKSVDTNAIMSFLGEEKIKELDSKALSLDEITLEHQDPKLILSKFDLHPVPSPRANMFIEEIQKSFDKGINRSFMFYGLPGTGKSTLAHTIIDHFGFRTLKIHPNDSIKLPYFIELIKLLKIEALILDDFDQVEMNDKLLEFLEVVNKDLKLTIGIANILDGFDPVVLRPGRFDEIKKIEQIEESTLIELLGNLKEEYFDKVRNWPVAYIKELVKQNLINPQSLADKYLDLNERVEKLIECYNEADEEVEDNEEIDL